LFSLRWIKENIQERKEMIIQGKKAAQVLYGLSGPVKTPLLNTELKRLVPMKTVARIESWTTVPW
jgi:hypothetical protein